MTPDVVPAVSIGVCDLHFSFANGSSLKVLKGLDFAVAEGEVLAVVGPSGCGKSTLLRLLSGLLVPSCGHVHIGGGSPQEAREQHHIGKAFQDPALLPWLTLLDNTAFPGRLAGFRRSQMVEVKARAADMLNLMGLDGFGDFRPLELSSGMRARASLARALVLDPKILLLDEPFASVDELTADEIIADLLALWRTHPPTTVLVTHNLTQAMAMADRILVLSSRPATVIDLIDSPRPKSADHEARFLATLRRMRAALRGQEGVL